MTVWKRKGAVWLAAYPQRRFSPIGSDVPGLRGANGDPFGADVVVEALRALAEKPAPPPVPPVHLALHEQRRAAGVAVVEAS